MPETLKTTRILLQEKPPEPQSLERTIEKFWQEFTTDKPHLKNNPKYVLQGKEDLEVSDDTLILRSFLSDYATVKFKNSRNSEYDKELVLEQKEFLDHHFLTLGVGAHVSIDIGSTSSHLMRIRNDHGQEREGLIDYVPQGLVEPEKTPPKDVLWQNFGIKYGDLTVIYHLEAKLESIEYVDRIASTVVSDH